MMQMTEQTHSHNHPHQTSYVDVKQSIVKWESLVDTLQAEIDLSDFKTRVLNMDLKSKIRFLEAQCMDVYPFPTCHVSTWGPPKKSSSSRISSSLISTTSSLSSSSSSTPSTVVVISRTISPIQLSWENVQESIQQLSRCFENIEQQVRSHSQSWFGSYRSRSAEFKELCHQLEEIYSTFERHVQDWQHVWQTSISYPELSMSETRIKRS